MFLPEWCGRAIYKFEIKMTHDSVPRVKLQLAQRLLRMRYADFIQSPLE